MDRQLIEKATRRLLDIVQKTSLDAAATAMAQGGSVEEMEKFRFRARRTYDEVHVILQALLLHEINTRTRQAANWLDSEWVNPDRLLAQFLQHLEAQWFGGD